MGPETARPMFVLENHEDEIYHDHHLGERSEEPDYCAFVDKSWVFNRAMEWVRPDNGTILCVTNGGDLALTGEEMVSEWFSDKVNAMESEGDSLIFRKRDKRNRACVTLPAFQFNIEQHPTAALEVERSTHPWQAVVIMKGRSGPPILSSGWKTDADSVTFNIADELRKHGHTLHCYELFFAVGVWCDNVEDEAEITFSMKLNAAAALIPCLPVIRTHSSAADGVPVSAIVVNEAGDRIGASATSVQAEHNGSSWDLAEANGIWTGLLTDLDVGDHDLRLVADGEVTITTNLSVRITDGEFRSYNKDSHMSVLEGKPTGPLTGSYQGFAYFKDVGLDSEEMVNGQDAFDAWDRETAPGEHWHYWEALSEAELDKRFSYLEQNGWDVLHLCQHWGTWEKLDAGGRIAPHGAEQVALYYRTASRHGMVVIQALSHYPYGLAEWEGHKTIPFRRYLDAGYGQDDWNTVDCDFTEMFHSYLSDYVTLFKDETGVFCMTTAGEGDTATSRERVNDTCRFVTALDRNHLFLSEPIMFLSDLPETYTEGWEQPMFGARIYHLAKSIMPEIDLGIEHKLYQTAPLYMAEGCWPRMHLYSKWTARNGRGSATWAGSAYYRSRVRDGLYLGLIHRTPVNIYWDEQHTEDEHKIFRQVRELVDWQQQWTTPPVAIRIGSENIKDAGRDRLADLESALTALPLMSAYVLPDRKPAADAIRVYDARDAAQGQDSDSPLVWDGKLPDDLMDSVPLRISGNYKAWYVWSADHRTLLAYLPNVGGHEELAVDLAGKLHRVAKPSPCEIDILNMPEEELVYRVYGLDKKEIVEQGTLTGSSSICFAASDEDYFVIIVPR